MAGHHGAWPPTKSRSFGTASPPGRRSAGRCVDARKQATPVEFGGSIDSAAARGGRARQRWSADQQIQWLAHFADNVRLTPARTNERGGRPWPVAAVAVWTLLRSSDASTSTEPSEDSGLLTGRLGLAIAASSSRTCPTCSGGASAPARTAAASRTTVRSVTATTCASGASVGRCRRMRAKGAMVRVATSSAGNWCCRPFRKWHARLACAVRPSDFHARGGPLQPPYAATSKCHRARPYRP